MKESGKARGFTILEVALVVAIAGLIFLMMVVALPALRASQRDAIRREDVIGFVNKVKTYQEKNRGTLPGAANILDDGAEAPENTSLVAVDWGDDLEDKDRTSWEGFYRDFLGERFTDPSGEHYRLEINNCSANIVGNECDTAALAGAVFPNNYTIRVDTAATCAGEKAVQASDRRKIAARYVLESGGVFCINS